MCARQVARCRFAASSCALSCLFSRRRTALWRRSAARSAASACSALPIRSYLDASSIARERLAAPMPALKQAGMRAVGIRAPGLTVAAGPCSWPRSPAHGSGDDDVLRRSVISRTTQQAAGLPRQPRWLCANTHSWMRSREPSTTMTRGEPSQSTAWANTGHRRSADGPAVSTAGDERVVPARWLSTDTAVRLTSSVVCQLRDEVRPKRWQRP